MTEVDLAPITQETQAQAEELTSFDYGVRALECLEASRQRGVEESLARNNFLKLANAYGIFAQGAREYKDQEFQFRLASEASMVESRYNIARAIGIEAQDPSLPDAGDSLGIESQADIARLNVAFFDFLKTYNNEEISGTILRVKSGTEDLVIGKQKLGETSGSRPNLGPELSANGSEIIREWLSQIETNEPKDEPDALFETDLTTLQKATQKGGLYLLAAQTAISILNTRETYDPKIDGSASKPTEPTKAEKALMTHEQILRERLRAFKTYQLQDFANACIIRGSEFIGRLRSDGYLDKDYPDVDQSDYEKIVGVYTKRYGQPSDKRRAWHKRALRRAITSPVTNYQARRGSKRAPKSIQLSLIAK